MLLNGTCWYSQLFGSYIFDQREVHIVFCEQTEWQAGKVWAWFKKINVNNKDCSSKVPSKFFEMKIIYKKIQRILDWKSDFGTFELFSEKKCNIFCWLGKFRPFSNFDSQNKKLHNQINVSLYYYVL